MNAIEFNRLQLQEARLTPRHVTELVTAWQETHGLAVDGKAGDGETLPSITAAIAARDGTIPSVPSERCYPLRRLLDGRTPIVTSGHGSRNPTRPNHPGADIMYRYQVGDPPVPISDSGRTPGFWIPRDTYAVAQASGRVVLAGPTRTGFRVWIRHERAWHTGYFHLNKLAAYDGRTIQIGDVVTPGTPLGRVGDNPIDHDPDHLHAELWLGELDRYSPRMTRDPELFLIGATILSAIPPLPPA